MGYVERQAFLPGNKPAILVNLMDVFERFKEILDDLEIQAPVGDSQPVMGWNCTYLPLEILEAAGLQPYRFLPEPSSEKADAYLDPNFCPLITSALGKAIEGGYAGLSGMVMVNTCDGMRRLYDAWRFYSPVPFSFLLDPPRLITPASLAHFREQLEWLIAAINRHFGVDITNDKLSRAIESANSTRRLLKRLLALQNRGNPPLRHADIIDIVSEGFKRPRRLFNAALEQLVRDLGKDSEGPSGGLRVVISGSMLDGSALVRMVEELGGRVVASDLCVGGRLLDEVVVSSDPLWDLGQAYLKKRPCARMTDTGKRVSMLKGDVTRTGARGMIYFSLKFCDPYLYEAPAVAEELRKMEIPILSLEGEYTGRVSGGIRTRVQAFLEMLERDEP
jgi:benzoyl-CoA reductase/2-hydroxyglutaryl-CoA dehydratase subunit BcrC/BadD/HgdB